MLEVGTVERESCQNSDWSSSPSISYTWPGRTSSQSISRSRMSRDAELESSSRTTSPNRRRRSSDSTASSRSSASSDSSKSASRVTRKTARSVISIPGNSIGRKCEMTVSSGTRRLPTGTNRSSPSGTFTRAKRSSPRLGIDRDHAQRERQAGDVGERLAGSHREGRQDREDLALEVPAELLVLALGALVDRRDLDAGRGERRSYLTLPQASPAARSAPRPAPGSPRAPARRRVRRRSASARPTRRARAGPRPAP